MIRRVPARALALLAVLLPCTSLPEIAQAQEKIRAKVRTLDGRTAEVFLKGRLLGKTDSILEIETTGLQRPFYFELTLRRQGFIPSQHTLMVEDQGGLWEPPPLALYPPFRILPIRVTPSVKSIFLEQRSGELVPAGQDSKLNLEIKSLPGGDAFEAHPLTVVLETPGYRPTRVKLPATVWAAPVYPPPDQSPLLLEPKPGWRPWLQRMWSESPAYLVAGVIMASTAGALAWMRWRDLRKIARAHRQLQQWADRLDQFVEGSQALLSPLTNEALVEKVAILTRRLVRCDGVYICLSSPLAVARVGFFCQDLAEIANINDFLAQKLHPLRIDDTSQSRFPGLAPECASLLAIPIAQGGKHWGNLIAGSGRRKAFSETDSEALSVLAFQMAGASQRTLLHEETLQAYSRLAESEAQLVHTEKSSAVGQLAAGIAHELNTPLGAVGLGLEMAMSLLEKNPERAIQRLRSAASAAERATQIVSKLLFYSREARLDGQKFRLEDVLSDTLRFLQHSLSENGVVVEVEPANDLWVEGNQSEIQQVISNLVLNAQDAVLKGSFRRQINIRLGSGSPETVFLLVEDSGEGVDPAVEKKVFDPFFTTKNMGEGTGLGLSFSRRVAERHQGSLTLDRLANPTLFRLTLPRVRS